MQRFTLDMAENHRKKNQWFSFVNRIKFVEKKICDFFCYYASQ
jgi:hypothetical protein